LKKYSLSSIKQIKLEYRARRAGKKLIHGLFAVVQILLYV